MKKCFFLFLFLTLVLSNITGSPVSNFEIFGGQDAVEGQFPYQVSIQRNNWPFGYEHYCGGSIISPNWIVTAGHCCEGYPETHVVAGILNRSEAGEYRQTRTVTLYFVHEDYIGNANPNDICVMKLNESWVFNDRVKAITLPEPNLNTTGEAVASGWGQVSGNLFPVIPDTLQYQISNIPDEETCVKLADSTGPNHYNVSANVCTDNPEPNHGICRGDSGGPLAQAEKLIGISSWGFLPCGHKDAPSVFTRVSNYIDWIKKHVTDL